MAALLSHASGLPLTPVDPENSAWFIQQLQPHEAMLRAWLRSQFSTQTDIDDLVCAGKMDRISRR